MSYVLIEKVYVRVFLFLFFFSKCLLVAVAIKTLIDFDRLNSECLTLMLPVANLANAKRCNNPQNG